MDITLILSFVLCRINHTKVNKQESEEQGVFVGGEGEENKQTNKQTIQNIAVSQTWHTKPTIKNNYSALERHEKDI